MAQDTRAGQWLGEYLQLGMQHVLSVLRIIPPTLLTDGLQQLIEQLQVSGCGVVTAGGYLVSIPDTAS